MKRFACVLVLLSILIDSSLAATYRVRREDSNVGFTIMKWMVFKEEGRFKEYHGTITYDRTSPRNTTVDFTVKTASIDSRNSDRDNVIRSKEFLDASRFPTLRFKSVSAEPRGKDTLMITGDFTLRDITKRLTIPVRVSGVSRVGDLGEVVGFETSFTVDREDFGVAPGMTMIGKDVTIHMIIGAATAPVASGQ